MGSARPCAKAKRLPGWAARSAPAKPATGSPTGSPAKRPEGLANVVQSFLAETPVGAWEAARANFVSILYFSFGSRFTWVS